MKKITYNNVDFLIPQGYATLKDYAATMKLNLKTAQTNNRFAKYIPMYTNIIAKLNSVSL